MTGGRREALTRSQPGTRGFRGHTTRRIDGVCTAQALDVLLTLALVAAACGGDDDEGGGDDAAGETGDEGEEGGTPTTEARDEGEPVQGGSITVGLEAESNGWRPGTASWASSGYNVAYTIHDPLMARTAEGSVEPFLAESLEPNEDASEYTLTLRPDVTFHDGTRSTRRPSRTTSTST
jgi:peptide/nickel transport system substrate-binding protein